MPSHLLSLSVELAKADFKLRNEGSYLGILWYLLNPLLTFALLMTVFSGNLGRDVPSYPLYMLLGIIMFNFFQQTTIQSAMVLQQSRGIVRSIRFPHEALVVSIVLRNLVAHGFEIVVFSAFLLFFNASLGGLAVYVLIALFLSLFTMGVSLLLSALNIYFVDLSNIWTFASRLLWFATPIFYAAEMNESLSLLNLFNPLYYFITSARDIVVYARIPGEGMIVGILIYTVLSLMAGSLVFKRLKKKFGELV